jgi:flagellar biogenesis protein FliO
MKKLLEALRIYFNGKEDEKLEAEFNLSISTEKLILILIFIILLLWYIFR